MVLTGQQVPLPVRLLYPKKCGACGMAVDEQADRLCWDCRANVRAISGPMCDVCGDPVEGRFSRRFVCRHCREAPPSFDVARSAILYDGAGAEVVQAFKYRGALWLEELLVDWLEACLETWLAGERPDYVVPVPLHPRRWRERGFNQAVLLAAGLAWRRGWRCCPAVLKRIKPTLTQTRLTAPERLSNVAGAFRAAPVAELNGRTVLLVDDVMTTGATVSACAHALKAAGVSRVVVVTAARGQRGA